MKTRKAKLCDCGFPQSTPPHQHSLPDQPQHTPTPWIQTTRIKEFVPKEQGGGLKRTITGADNQRVCSLNMGDLDKASANAAFIVRAVNSHEELLKTGKQLYQLALRLQQNPDDTDARLSILIAADDFEEAIAKAEGK